MTIKVPEHLRHQLKRQALDERKTMSTIVQEALQNYLNQFTTGKQGIELDPEV
ncbi:hypothetical protein QUA43_30730 [Microcoleus sp. N9_B4]|uniref:hypothetical protein n=1 Tax=Microcoleus sp. N9_B4 TaxID=3055386 RepID=UPI002FD15A37